jgi:hypothetical protein
MVVIALALLALLLPIAILAAWHLDRRARIDENRALRADLATQREEWARERREHADERRELLNRIKPETAQYATPTDVQPVKPVRFDDDDSYWNAVADPLALSKDDLAEVDARLDAAQRDLAAGLVVASGGET